MGSIFSFYEYKNRKSSQNFKHWTFKWSQIFLCNCYKSGPTVKSGFAAAIPVHCVSVVCFRLLSRLHDDRDACYWFPSPSSCFSRRTSISSATRRLWSTWVALTTMQRKWGNHHPSSGFIPPTDQLTNRPTARPTDQPSEWIEVFWELDSKQQD